MTRRFEPVVPASRTLPAPAQPTREIAVWGMAIFCATEVALFASLISAYFFLGVSNPQWPPAGIEDPKLTLPLIMTVLLLASSASVWWGEQGIKQGDAVRLRLGLGGGIALGVLFLVAQSFEYADKLRHFGPRTHAYTASFFTITGFHGVHVAFGVLLLTLTLGRGARGHFTAHHHSGVTVTSLYWHTVDAIWLAILTSLYLSPRWY